MECLCTEKKMEQMAPEEAGPPNIITTRMTDDECLAWLCGGSSHNWVCCHEAPIEFWGDIEGYTSGEHHPDEDVKFSQEDSASVDTSAAPGQGTVFSLTAYAEPCFPEHKCSSKATMIGFGQIAVDPKVIPYGTKVRFTGLVEADKHGKPKPGASWQASYKVDGKELLDNSTTNSGQTFCACDSGGDIKKYRIDVWLPGLNNAKQFGRRNATVDIIEYNSPDCCKNTHICCLKSALLKNSVCKTYSDDKNPTGFICVPENLDACKVENKSEYNTVKKNWCKKYYDYAY